MPELLEVHDLVSGYGRLRVLNEISLAVARGEVFAVIGANGVGKSTLLKTLAGALPAWAGRIVLDGADLTRLPAHRAVRAGITLVPEGRRIFTGLTVEENLLVGAHTVADRHAVGQLLERAYARFPHLAERRSQPGGQLSGGEQQMLAIARALMGRPRLLLLDEPSLGLAPLIVRDVFRALPEIRADGTTILLVEQNAHLAFEVCDHAAVMRRGTIELSGTASQLAGDDRVRSLYLGNPGRPEMASASLADDQEKGTANA